MIAKIKAAFQDWSKAEVELPPVPKVSYEFPSTVSVVRKDDLNQSVIRLGHIGTVMSDPDYHALMVMNEILGGGFTSRLFKNVRSRQGLAYSVGGACGANYEYPGMFTLSCQTKLKSTVQATEAIVAEVRKMAQEEVTDEELALAKESYLNSFVFNFESKGQIVNRLMTYAYYGYPGRLPAKDEGECRESDESGRPAGGQVAPAAGQAANSDRRPSGRLRQTAIHARRGEDARRHDFRLEEIDLGGSAPKPLAFFAFCQ